jgi:hypothetical protein
MNTDEREGRMKEERGDEGELGKCKVESGKQKIESEKWRMWAGGQRPEK